MILENKSKLLYYFFSLFFLSIVSFYLFWRSISGECKFLSNWPFCSGLLEAGGIKLAAGTICLLLVVLSLMIFTIASTKCFFNQGMEKLFSKKLLVFILVCVFLIIPFASADSVYYFNVGKTILEGLNPYVSNWQIANNFSLLVGGAATGLMYGPLAAGLIFFVYLISFGNYWLFIFVWKVLMLLVMGMVGLLVKRISVALNPEFNSKNFWVYWLSLPILLFEWIISGHFDGLWLIFVLSAIWFSLKDKWLWVLPMLTIGIWIKFIPLFMLPWFALWWWQGIDGNNKGKKMLEMLWSVLTSVTITILSWFYFWQGTDVFKPILLQSKWVASSLFSVIYYSLKPIFVNLFDGNAHYILTRLVHLTLFVLLVYFIWPYIKKCFTVLVRKEKMPAQGYLQAIFITMLVYLVIWQKSFWPWYYTWLIPFGLVIVQSASSEWLKKILLWISTAPLLFYIFQMWQKPGDNALWFSYYVFFVINAAIVYMLYKWRKTNYDL